MLILHVFVHVKPEFVDRFKAAILDNARNTIKEPGCRRFDVVQEQDDPTRFVLIEVYDNPEAHLAHRETAHYKTWRDLVNDWMASPRTAKKFTAIHGI
jgi:quinol monooxygenase YgiN